MSSNRRPIKVVGVDPTVKSGHAVPPSQLAGYALLPLRAFLGFTFCFAGLQKLANPGFFHKGNPASIQAQMLAASRHSPIHGLLGPMSHHAVAVGVLIALGELAVGVGTLAGLLTRVAAVGGVLISFGLFLSVSFHTNPYYTGSDIVFLFAWLPLLIAGGGPLSLDAWVASTVAARAARRPVDVQRRQLIGVLAAGVGAVAMFGAGAAAGLGRLFHGTSANAADGASLGSPSASASASATTAAPTTAAPTTAAPTTAAPTRAAAHPPGTKLGPASAVPVKGAASFTDPATGDPALVVQPTKGKFLAFDAVCPHAGCTVEYDSGNTAFVCPCHGSQFNGTTGAVEVGPARSGLGKIEIAEGSDGQLYAK